MSDMQGNPHHDEARQRLEYAASDVSANWLTNTGEYKSDTLATAQIEATLALTFEQRTANLVAFYGMIPRGALDNETIRLRSKIIERLGLK